MSDYDNRMFSSDLDAYRSDGVVYTDSITFSGNLGASASLTETSTGITITDLDFYQLLFDNSDKHSGKYRDIQLEDGTLVLETTHNSELTVRLTMVITGDVLQVEGTILNAYAGTVALTTTTINFRLVAYDSTLL